MAVTIEKINTALHEAERFIQIALKARKRLEEDRYATFGCKETGNVRRASMDLSNALIRIRQSSDR